MCSNKEIKSDIRAEVLARRDAISKDDRAAWSLKVAAHFEAYVTSEKSEPNSDRFISAFLPIRSEIDLMPLIKMLWSYHINVCLPALLNRTDMEFRTYVPDMPIEKNGFGTSAPDATARAVIPALMLVPLAAFDCKGNRIGYGAGHYDRAIDRQIRAGDKPKLIGAAFSCQEVDHIPAEPHDMLLDGILTELGLRIFEQTPKTLK